MKKGYLMSFALVLAIVILTGCGSSKKTLTCVQENSDNGFTNTDKIVYEFESDRVKKATQVASINAQGDYAQYLGNYKDSASQAVEGYNKLDGMSAKVEEEGSTVTLTVEMNPMEMSESDFTLYNMGENYESMKIKLTDQGYTCK